MKKAVDTYQSLFLLGAAMQAGGPCGPIYPAAGPLNIRLRRGAEIRLDHLVAFGEFGRDIFRGNSGHHDHILSVFPICGGSNAVVGRELKRINNPQDFQEIPSG